MQKLAHTRSNFLIIFWVIGFLLPFGSWAQCTSPINIFPYTEGFEASNGNWTVGGTAPSWAWGTPSKPAINSAGSGNRCWVTGGLNGSSYNDSESSWLQSPCFDLRPLTNPQIRLKIFWETELQYDGANLQYSTDGGTSWTVLGDVNSNNNCQGSNWYNYSAVQFIGFQNGWSGNVQSGGGNCRNGQGSGQWVQAFHSLGMLAGQSQVIFRFQFGSGRICNAFDGIAIDDIEIREAAPNTAGFSFSCGANLQANFASSASACAAAYSWDFGDPASGPDNFSTASAPTHIFSGPGNYQVSLTVSFLNGPQVVVRNPVTVFDASASVSSQPTCFGYLSGIVQVSTNPVAGNYTYSWNTSPPQSTASVSNLPAGDYAVNVSLDNGCTVNIPVSIIQPDELIIQTNVQQEKCGQNNGAIEATVTGGTQPYTYAWSNTATTAGINQLSEGLYKLSVSDANGCRAETGDITITDMQNNLSVNLGNNQFICPGQSIVLNPGNFASYLWQDQSTNPTYTVSQSGLYSVVVSDQDGCKDSAKVEVTVDCRDIYFPTAFTPGGDGRNDGFGPLGDIASLKNYTLSVYGRWGQLLYSSVNPFEKWDGRYKGMRTDLQSCVWIATFTRGTSTRVETRKGFVIIIR